MENIHDKKKFGARVRVLRDYFGQSQAKLAQYCGVNASTVANVELGKNSPSIEFLHALWASNPKIRLEWLLTGEGEMLTSGGGAPAVTARREEVDPLVAELGELRLIAEAGRWARLRLLLIPLLEASSPIQRPALARLLKVTPDDINSDLAILRRMGLVVEGTQGVSATGEAVKLGSTADGSRLAIDGIRVLLERVLPAADRRDGTGCLVFSEVDVQDGKALLADVLQATRAVVERHPEGSERVTLVLGVHAEDSSNDHDLRASKTSMG